MLDVSHQMSVPIHPQGNSKNERMVKSQKPHLSLLQVGQESSSVYTCVQDNST